MLSKVEARHERLLEEFFIQLEKEQIEYCVLSVGTPSISITDGDIDISVSDGSFSEVGKFIHRFAEKNDLMILQDIWSGVRSRAFLLTDSSQSDGTLLKLDFMAGYGSYYLGQILTHQELSSGMQNNGTFWHISNESELAYLALRHVLKNDGRDYRKQRIEELFFGLDKTKLRASFDPIVIDAVSSVLEGKASMSTADTTRLRKKILLHGRSRMGMWRRTYSLLAECARALFRLRNPVGLSVAFLGPDGAGKSTLILEVQKRLLPIFPKSTVFHWRPRFLPTPSALRFWNPGTEKSTNPTPHSVQPHGKLVSILRLVYFYLDFLIGYVAIVRPQTSRKNLVIFDRYLHDVVVDPLRYRMQLPEWFLQVILAGTPKPDIIFILSCNPKIIHARKNELSEQEINRQLKKLASISRDTPRFVKIDASKTVDVIAERVVSAINENRAGQHQGTRG